MDATWDVIRIVAVFGMPVLIVWIVYYYDSRVKEQFHPIEVLS
tara:strand:- start:652 stop:780 length:129 start_codon:yes stop_codon:yes gene_type:complete